MWAAPRSAPPWPVPIWSGQFELRGCGDLNQRCRFTHHALRVIFGSTRLEGGIIFPAYARRDVTKKDAEAWFGIRPARRARNVVPMRGAG